MRRYRVRAEGWRDDGTYHPLDDGLFFKGERGRWYAVSQAAERRGKSRGRERLEERLGENLRESSAYRRYERLFAGSRGALDCEELLQRSLLREGKELLGRLDKERGKVPTQLPAYLACTMPREAYTAGEYSLVDRRTGEEIDRRTLKSYARLAQKEEPTRLEEERLAAFNDVLLLQANRQQRGGIRQRLTGAIDRLLQGVRREEERPGAPGGVDLYNELVAIHGGAKHRIYEAGAAALGLQSGAEYQEAVRRELASKEGGVLQRFDINLLAMDRVEFTEYVRSAYEGSRMTLRELATAVTAETGMRVSTSTLSRIAREAINKSRGIRGAAPISSRREAQQAYQEEREERRAASIRRFEERHPRKAL